MKRCMLLVMLLLIGLASPALAANDIIRIHVLAHNDTTAEQELKLMVRDVALEYMNPWLSNAATSEEAVGIIEQHLERLRSVINNFLKKQGSEHEVNMQWGVFVFPTRVYGQSALPAGKYTALNIHIGAGQGKNWWCVMYPPLCYVDGVVGQSQTPKYEFAVVNWIRGLLGRLWP